MARRARRRWPPVVRSLSRDQELAAIDAFVAADKVQRANPPQVYQAPRASPPPRADWAAPDVMVWTDGSCLGNPGPGGWAAILRYGEHEKQISGSERQTTNNQMELLAIVRALEVLKRPGLTVRLHTDSMYAIGGMTKGVDRRQRRMRQTFVPNAQLWVILDAVAADYTMQWQWVRGHNGDTMNERCDRLAQAAAARQR